MENKREYLIGCFDWWDFRLTENSRLKIEFLGSRATK